MNNVHAISDRHCRVTGADRLDMARFEADLKSEALLAAVEADKKAGTAVVVGGTPTLFVNGKPFVSGCTYRELRRAIEAQTGVRLGTMLAEDRLLRGEPGKSKVLEPQSVVAPSRAPEKWAPIVGAGSSSLLFDISR